MWDPASDLEHHNDLPCNTQIMFRSDGEYLDMTVINRSNDFVWGMMGANIVHMTILHELMALSCELRMRHYRVLSNNCHIYPDMPNFSNIWNSLSGFSVYPVTNHVPIIHPGETMEDLLEDCSHIIELTWFSDLAFEPKTRWVRNVVIPIMESWEARKCDQDGLSELDQCIAEDWRIACRQWLERRM
jgi:hypothetical protein